MKKLILLAALSLGIFVSGSTFAQTETAGASTGIQGLLDDFDIATYAGQHTMLISWGGWCTPCWQKMEEISALRDSYGGELTVVGIVHQSDPEWTAELFERFDLDFPVYTDQSGFGVTERFGLELMPEFVKFYAPDGQEISTIKWVPLDEIRAELAKIEL